MAELSEGELPEDEGNVEEEGREQGEVQEEDDESPPAAKKQRHDDCQHQASACEQPSQKEDWEQLTGRQRKRRMKREKREQAQREREAMAAAAAVAAASSRPTSETPLTAQQAKVLNSLVKISKGKQDARACFQKMKTVQFQSLVSHLVMGSPELKEPIAGLKGLIANYKVVVLWLSMVSADLFRNQPEPYFPQLNSLTPGVVFNIEHPGSMRFVKSGLDTFIMISSNSNGDRAQQPPTKPPPPTQALSPPDSSSAATPMDQDTPTGMPPHPSPWCTYLCSAVQLSDNDFPCPSSGEVDQLGRIVGKYVSVVKDWPEGEIVESAQVQAAMARRDNGGVGMEGEKMLMVAIDCEMVETKSGSELARISIVNEAHECIYDTFVKPENPVVDYRTKYSGITESTLEDVTTTLDDVHRELLSLLPSNFIAVGHSLENDFHAMKFKHPFVIDTSLIFTPFATPTSKPGLRRLCKELLATDIQNAPQGGHDSTEDAVACMRLVQLKLERGSSCQVAFNETTSISPNIFIQFESRGHLSGMVDKDSVLRQLGRGVSLKADVKTDDEAVEKCEAIIEKCRFTFVQFHGMEYFLKSEEGNNVEKKREMANTLDRQVMTVIENCPSKTIVLVTCGSSDIRQVRSVQQEEFPDHALLKKLVMLARTGCVTGFVVK